MDRQFTEEEKESIIEVSSKISIPQICEHLEYLAQREKDIYLNIPDMKDEHKQVIIWSIGALCAAAEKLTPNQKDLPKTETDQD